MNDGLWKECLLCKNKCCKRQEGIYPLSVLQKEIKKLRPEIENRNYRLSDFKDIFPCIFFNKDEKCEVYKDRPLDCILFPFDIIKIKNKYCWIYWDLPFSCSISQSNDFERYLQYFEENIIPNYRDSIGEFSKIDLKYFIGKLRYNIIRKVNFREI